VESKAIAPEIKTRIPQEGPQTFRASSGAAARGIAPDGNGRMPPEGLETFRTSGGIAAIKQKAVVANELEPDLT